jgi:transposase-like protein
MQKLRKLKDLSDEEVRELARIIKKLYEEELLSFREISQRLEKDYRISISCQTVIFLYYSNFLYPRRKVIFSTYAKNRERSDEEIIEEIYKIDDEIGKVPRSHIECLVEGFRIADRKYNRKEKFRLLYLYLLLGYRVREVRKLLGYEVCEKWDEEKVKRCFFEVEKELGRIPTVDEFMERYGGAIYFIIRKWGSWSNFVKSLGRKPYRECKTHSSYSLSFKINAISRYLESEDSMKKISKELGIPKSTLICWLNNPKILENYIQTRYNPSICLFKEFEKYIHPSKIEIIREKLKKFGMLKRIGNIEFVGRKEKIMMMEELYREYIGKFTTDK